MTRAVIALQTGQSDRVEDVDELIDVMLEMSRAELEQLRGPKWAGVRDFLHQLGR